MIRNKQSSIFAMCLLLFLFFPHRTKAAFQTPVEFQMRNNETSGLNFSIKLFGSFGHLVGQLFK